MQGRTAAGSTIASHREISGDPRLGDEDGQGTLEYALLVAFFFLIFIVLERQTTQFLLEWFARTVAAIGSPAV